MRFAGLILDFDGVLIESEYVGNRQLAEFLTGIGHPTRIEDALREFMGLSGRDFLAAIERWIGRAVPDEFHVARMAEDERVMVEGLEAVAGAVAFVENLPKELPRAIASSSSSAWIRAHLRHLGLERHFGEMIFSGREHVVRGKPAPDIYLRAADAMGLPIDKVAIVEDSPVGARGALASGAHVIGLVAGSHCLEGHDRRLRELGVRDIAHSFEDVARLLFAP